MFKSNSKPFHKHAHLLLSQPLMLMAISGQAFRQLGFSLFALTFGGEETKRRSSQRSKLAELSAHSVFRFPFEGIP